MNAKPVGSPRVHPAGLARNKLRFTCGSNWPAQRQHSRTDRRNRNMTYLRTIPASEATGELAALYREYAYPDGSIDEAYVALSIIPPLLRAEAELYRVTMYRSSTLTRGEREMVAVLVSALNRCTRCVSHHAESLRRLLPHDRLALISPLSSGALSDYLSERERAMLTLAQRLTVSPHETRRADLDVARQAGLCDEELLDIINIAAYFSYANRLSLGLGIGTEDR